MDCNLFNTQTNTIAIHFYTDSLFVSNLCLSQARVLHGCRRSSRSKAPLKVLIHSGLLFLLCSAISFVGTDNLLGLATIGYHASFGAEAVHETMLPWGDASDEALRTRQPCKAKQREAAFFSFVLVKHCLPLPTRD
jgi:hypothetical protein